MKIPTSEEKPRIRTINIIMADNEPDVNITVKTASEGNGDFEVDTFNALILSELLCFLC
jgi:hypothetical protein